MLYICIYIYVLTYSLSLALQIYGFFPQAHIHAVIIFLHVHFFLPRTISEWIRMRFDAGTLNDVGKQSLWEVFQRQAGLTDDLAFTHLTLALLALSQSAYSDALSMLQNAKSLCESSSSPAIKLHLQAEVHVTLGSAYADLGQWEESNSSYQKALSLMESRYHIYI